MCGRYTLTSSPQAVRALFHYDEQPNFPPRYNIAPAQPIAIVRLMEGKRHFALVRWGLLPSWAKDPKAFSLLINARGESVTEKPAFRNAMKRRRCLIPADGFYEWQAAGARKQPYFIRAKSGAPLAFAGLWETVDGPNGEEVDTAAIVTTNANHTLGKLHDRMPVIVPPEAFDLWLGSGVLASDADAKRDLLSAVALIAPAPEGLLEAYPVTPEVNRVVNDNPKLPERITVGAGPETATAPKSGGKRQASKRAKKDDRQESLF